MKTRTILFAALALQAGSVGCRNADDTSRPEQPLGGLASGTDLPTTMPAAPTGPSVIGVNTMHADDGALAGARVGILAIDGFDEDELVEPRQAYANEGATTLVVSPKTGMIQGYRAEAKGDFVKVDMAMGDATSGEFDALLLPGGILNGDRMRLDPVVTTFVRSFAMSGKPIAAICHGIWLLVENGGVRGRKVTSCPSLRTDLKNAGAMWVDENVVEDRNLVTSRGPDDIPALIASSIALFAKRLDLSSKPPAIGGGPSSTE